VLVIEQAVSDEWRSLVCDWLVRDGCRYLMAWGRDCEIWHDDVDQANLAMFDFEVPDRDLVMTTWHSDESLAEVFWFAGNCASHPDVDLESTIIIHICDEAHEAELTREFTEAQGGVAE
jgi:hypothetical protein